MPLRNPLLSSLTATDIRGNAASVRGTSYLPTTSATYDDSEDETDHTHESDVESAIQSSRTPVSDLGAGYRQGTVPKRPPLSRRVSKDTFKSSRSDAEFSDTPDFIRARTAFLADMPFRRTTFTGTPSSLAHLSLGTSAAVPRSPGWGITAQDPRSSVSPPAANVASGGPSSMGSLPSATPDAPSCNSNFQSGITRLIAREKSRSSSSSPERATDGSTNPDTLHPVPKITVRHPTGDRTPTSDADSEVTPTPSRAPTRRQTIAQIPSDVAIDIGNTETTPLLSSAAAPYGTPLSTVPSSSSLILRRLLAAKDIISLTSSHLKSLSHGLREPETYKNIGKEIVSSIPAVILGLLLNILDGLSYGFIIFPVGAAFNGFGSIGVSMFFVTTIISQLVYTLGGSFFGGANGSMMIEVVPFFHLIAEGIVQVVGEDDVESIVATTMVAFAFSSLITGITFFALGYFKLGNIVGFFPRHILVGCIGGVGVFLLETGLEVSASIKDDEGFQYNLSTFKLFLGNAHILSLWLPAFGLAVLFRLITARVNHQLIFPLYFMAIPCIFYIIKAILHVDLDTLKHSGWVFDVGKDTVPWYQFYTYFNWHKTSFDALVKTMPTQFALLFFNILHPPLNVPALAVSLNADNVDTNRELIAHGISNGLAGLLGTVPNYLVYVNTLMFYRVGGGSRISGLLLAAGTVVLLVIGTGPIGYIPIMLVGALIFVLGIDLVKEAVWDTRHRTSRSEYITIVAIMVCMSLWDFVTGVLFGIVLACFFFVIQSSRERSIRALYTGSSSVSAVRRPSAHREFLRDVGRQTIIMRLQGFLFFGTINHVEDTIRRFLDHATWEKQPIRFLIIDLSLVGGLDMSSAEAFVRVHRLLGAKRVILIFCGADFESSVANALKAVDLWTDRALGVEVFAHLSEAMEWTENAYLKAWFSAPMQQKVEPAEPIAFPGQLQRSPIVLTESFVKSPRQYYLQTTGTRIIAPEVPEMPQAQQIEPVNTLLKVFSSLSQEVDDCFYASLAPYFRQVAVPEGHVLFRQGDMPDGLYLIEHGVLRATYRLADFAEDVEESMVSGTLAGELSALSNMPRNSTVVAERRSVLWRLDLGSMERLEKEQPEVAKMFIKLVLKAAKVDYDALLTSMANRV